MTIFAFTIFFVSCTPAIPTQPTSLLPPPPPIEPPSETPASPIPPPSLLPDLTISDISLSETGTVVVKISNIGKGPVPSRAGRLSISIDGQLKWSTPLENPPDRDFLQPGESATYSTPVELEGKQEVRATLDQEERFVEENDLNNSLAKSLGKEKIEVKPPLLPDLALADLFVTPQRKLAVIISNIGEAPLPLSGGTLKVRVDGSLKGIYTLGSLSNQSNLAMKGSLTLTTPLTLIGRHEIDAQIDFMQGVKEIHEENNQLKKVLEGLPVGPDMVVKDVELTEDLTLMIILGNKGEVDLRRGVTFRIRIYINDRKISDFDHFVSEIMKAHFGNRYVMSPPYPIGITGISKVKVFISPKSQMDDTRPENNILERTFIIFPFKMGSQGREEFSFSFSSPRLQIEGQSEKIRVEARGEGIGTPLMLSFKKSGAPKGIPTLSGKSPLKVEFPIIFEEGQKENVWSIGVTNLADKKVEGNLIIQHP